MMILMQCLWSSSYILRTWSVFCFYPSSRWAVVSWLISLVKLLHVWLINNKNAETYYLLLVVGSWTDRKVMGLRKRQKRKQPFEGSFFSMGQDVSNKFKFLQDHPQVLSNCFDAKIGLFWNKYWFYFYCFSTKRRKTVSHSMTSLKKMPTLNWVLHLNWLGHSVQKCLVGYWYVSVPDFILCVIWQHLTP